MSEKKDFKDYSMIKYLAKGMKVPKGAISKDMIIVGWTYGDADFLLDFEFENKRCCTVAIVFDDIYEKYGKNIANSYNEFVEKVVEKYSFYRIVELDGSNAIVSDVSENRVEHSASQALTNLSVFIKVMNDFLGNHEEEFGEKDIREFHQSYLAHQHQKMRYSMIASVVSFVIGIVFFILAATVAAGAGFGEVLLILLGVLLVVSGFISFFFFMARRKFYSATLVKAQRNRT